MKTYLSIVVPVYNEEENIKPLVDEIYQSMESLDKEWELLIVDDSSKDNTCLLYTSPSPRDVSSSRMPSSA